MEINVAKAISELLYEYQSVVIPGIGGFTSAEKSAVIDYVQGTVAPPSKSLQFNDNLSVNDGILINHLTTKYNITTEDAQKAIEQYVAEIKVILEKGEIVEIPKVGRLYKDYENNLKFLPENTNFNTNSFGLPSVNFYPIIREKTGGKIGAAAATMAATTKKNTTTQKKASSTTKNDGALPKWMSWGLPLLLGLAVIVIGIGIYALMTDTPVDQTATDASLNEERINQKPSEEDLALTDDPEDIEDFKEENEIDYTENNGTTPASSEDVETEPTNDINTESPTLSPNAKEAFIILHSFGSKANAEKFGKRLTLAGFNAYSEKGGSLTRVGVRHTYETKGELNKMVKELKDKYNTTPKIKLLD